MYEQGEGAPQNYAEAAKWYRKAAEQGNATAQESLGSLYEQGQGVPQNYIWAHMWFNLAIYSNQASLDEIGPDARDICGMLVNSTQPMK